MLTRTHFEAIASIIKQERENPNGNENTLVYRLAEYFEKENPRFDRIRFMNACGLPL